MPKAAQIVHQKYRREIERRRGWYAVARWLVVGGLVLGLGFCVVLALGITAVSAFYASLTADLPDPTQLPSTVLHTAVSDTPPTRIYALTADQTPVLLYEIPPLSASTWLPLEEIPPHIRNAIIAAEDPTFWERPFPDIITLLNNLLQLNKDTLPLQNTLIGKTIQQTRHPQTPLQLILLSHRAASLYTKEEILAWRLNTAYFGNLAFGIEAAAQTYFQKPTAEITLPEAAFLAALLTRPDLNPVDQPELVKARQEQILDIMADKAFITTDQLTLARFTPIHVADNLATRSEVIAPHFVRYVQQELERRFGPEVILTGGLQVFTTLDLSLQQQAECIARAHIARLSGRVGTDLPADERENCVALAELPLPKTAVTNMNHHATNAAIIALDPATSTILAMVGSLNYRDPAIQGHINMAINSQRQPGTALNPILYLTALSQGYTPATMILDIPNAFGTTLPFIPRNADNQFHGPMRLRHALGNGYEAPAVQIMGWVGPEKVVRTAHSLGITTLTDPQSNDSLTLPLGGGAVSLLDLTYAYAVMDNMGVMTGAPLPQTEASTSIRPLNPVAIQRVETADGQLLYAYEQPAQREILTPQLAYLINDMLSDRQARCAALGCPNILELPDNRPTAVYAGQTNDGRDLWTIGYTPQLVIGVWVGNSDNTPTNDLRGIDGAAPIWHALMTWRLQNEPLVIWPRPDGIVEMAVCDPSGLLPTPYCPTVPELFIQGTQPTVPDTMYQAFAINRETGRLATVYTPPELVEERVYRVLPPQAMAWAEEQGWEMPPTVYDTITGIPAVGEEVAILSPKPFAFVNGRLPITGTAQADDFAYYRLAYFQGLTPANLQVIADNVTEPKENGLLGVWETGELNGLYTLLLTMVHEDGRFTEVSLPLTIDNTPPSVEIITPSADQQIPASTGYITIRAQAQDDIQIARVEFYADDAPVPFATSRTPPFSREWRIRDSACHKFHVVAVDLAGNRTSSSAVSVCITNTP
ncbi:MAG: hypothetical protein D6706_14710 [Chloroflexi bacterium]|nr:MAG: hypothetical protein D6706_14710 [Chloroflexota bacterium]